MVNRTPVVRHRHVHPSPPVATPLHIGHLNQFSGAPIMDPRSPQIWCRSADPTLRTSEDKLPPPKKKIGPENCSLINNSVADCRIFLKLGGATCENPLMVNSMMVQDVDLSDRAQLSQRDRAAVYVSCGTNISVVFRIQRTLQ